MRENPQARVQESVQESARECERVRESARECERVQESAREYRGLISAPKRAHRRGGGFESR